MRAVRPLVAACAVLLMAAPAGAHLPEPAVPTAGAETQRALPLTDVKRSRSLQQSEPPSLASPRATCGPGARPETDIQGRVPPGEASKDGFECNLELLGREGRAGGFKVERYVDETGRECAYYDTALLFPTNALATSLAARPTGVAVLDMSDPRKPRRVTTLLTAAMQSPHESLLVNQKRGLLAAVLGNPAYNVGVVDLYDVSKDCRSPQLQSSLPVGYLGHESGWTPDGTTFYATSISTGHTTAVDVTNPKLPRTLWTGRFNSHGLTTNADGTRAYLAALDGLIILDTSEIQARKPNPKVPEVSRLVWSNMTIPQVALPVTIGGTPYLVEIDEFAATPEGNLAANGPRVGAGRIIDISDDRRPRVISNFRLAVHQPEHRARIAGDPGTQSLAQGYAGHYCGVPRDVDPGIVACSMIVSGLRVFDIRDPHKPRELAYFVAPPNNLGGGPAPYDKANYAMSRPSFAERRGEIWYSDGNSGFYALKVTNGAWPFAASRVGLPSNRRCLSRRNFRIRLRAPRGAGLRSARVTVDGRRVRVVRRAGRLTARVDLRRKPRSTIVVRVVARTTRGETVRETRRYRTCSRRR